MEDEETLADLTPDVAERPDGPVEPPPVAETEDATSRPATWASRLRPGDADSALSWVVWILVVAVLAAATIFGWTAYQDWRGERGATPASRALMDLEAAVRQDPNNANLRVRYGEALGAAGLLDAAVEQLLTALELDEGHTGAMIDLGMIAMQRKEFSTAEGYFQRVLELTAGQEFEGINQRREIAFFYLGEIALTEKRYEDAIPFFKAALRIRRDAADTYFELALAYKGLENVTLAKEQLGIALAFDPGFAQANYEMALILMDEGLELEAAQHAGRAALNAPGNQQAADLVDLIGPVSRRVAAASAALEAGDTKKALAEARIAQALDVSDFDAAVILGRALEASGDREGALEAFKGAARISAGDPVVTEALKRLGDK